MANQNAAVFNFPGHNRGRAAPPSMTQLIGVFSFFFAVKHSLLVLNLYSWLLCFTRAWQALFNWGSHFRCTTASSQSVWILRNIVPCWRVYTVESKQRLWLLAPLETFLFFLETLIAQPYLVWYYLVQYRSISSLIIILTGTLLVVSLRCRRELWSLVHINANIHTYIFRDSLLLKWHVSFRQVWLLVHMNTNIYIYRYCIWLWFNRLLNPSNLNQWYKTIKTSL